MKILVLHILIIPLLGALFHALLGSRVSRRLVETIACAAVLASFALALACFLAAGRQSYIFSYLTWFSAGSLRAAFDLYYTPLAAVMVLMVTFVSSLIHIYAVGYMRADDGYVRFFCYLNLFVFFMLVIVLADNLIFLFLGWEGVGFASYALIGFWYRDAANATAGRKAFMLTRIGDVAFAVALGLILVTLGDFSIYNLGARATTLQSGMATVLSLLFFWAAMGKSAQLPLSVWLPDAMAGPTPVSALIHAATMVTAGVYLLMRVFPLLALSPAAMAVVAGFGMLTAFYGACSALVQTNIKRVLAYSTISHLGFMFLAVGIGDITGGMFYLLSHAFSKSLLFLGAGCVIQVMHEDENIFNMGAAVRRRLPLLFFLFLAGALSLADIPPSTGFFSRDHILTALYHDAGTYHRFLWIAAIVTGAISVMYTFRLFFIVFTGQRQTSAPARELGSIPRLMVWILWPLALLSLLFEVVNLPPILADRQWLSDFLQSPLLPREAVIPHSLEWSMAIFDALVGLATLAAAYLFFGPSERARSLRLRLAQMLPTSAALQGFYLDRLYDALIVAPFRKVSGLLWRGVDEGGLDRLILGSGRALPSFSLGMRLWTTGRLSTYLKMTFLGMTLLLAILFMEVLTG